MYYPGYSQAQVTYNLVWQVITAITQANPIVVTTVNNSDFIPGMEVLFQIPPSFGMRELNNMTAQVTLVSGTSVTCNIDSTKFSPFAYPSPLPAAYSPPTMIPNSSGPYLSPQPLPYGNQDSFEGTVYNAGSV